MASPAFEDIAETFDFLDDWEDRYRHVIELGQCDARRWTRPFTCPPSRWTAVPVRSGSGRCVQGKGPDALFDFQGDSDAMIVRGLVAILHALYARPNGRAGAGRSMPPTNLPVLA